MTKFLVLLWIFSKSTFTSFAGLASLPEIREELVEQWHWLTDDELNQSIVIARTTPGAGGRVRGVGRLHGGRGAGGGGRLVRDGGAVADGELAGRCFGRRAQHPRVRSMLQCVMLASAALLVLAAVPLGRDALDGPLALGIGVVALPVLVSKRLSALWVIAAARR